MQSALHLMPCELWWCWCRFGSSRSAENVLAHYANSQLNNCCIDYAFASWKCVCDNGWTGLSVVFGSSKTVWPNWGAQRISSDAHTHAQQSQCILNQMFCVHVDSVALLQIIVCLWATIKSNAKHKLPSISAHILLLNGRFGTFCSKHRQKAVMLTFTNGA